MKTSKILLFVAALCISACTIPSLGDKTVAQQSKLQQAAKAQKPAEPFVDMRTPQKPAQGEQIYSPPAVAKTAVDETKTVAVSSQAINDGKTRVAILLPLSGKNAAIGQAMLNAAQMAVFDLAGDNFELMPRDTDANVNFAAQDAIGSGAQLLIGPLFASDVATVKPVVQTSAVNMLALSSDVSLAESGVYVMGFAPASMAERIVGFASKRGLTRFAGIFSSDAYGKLMQQSFSKAVVSKGGSLVAVESYDNPSDTGRAVSAIMEKKDQIDALFIPSGGNELKQIATQLLANGFDKGKIKLLGSGLWDEAGVEKFEGLEGSWYVAPESEARKNFIKAYSKTYGSNPPRLATLAYDATALAVILKKRGDKYDRVSIVNPSGFSGVDGIFRLTKHGLAERGLAISEIRNGIGKIIDPAPTTFVGM